MISILVPFFQKNGKRFAASFIIKRKRNNYWSSFFSETRPKSPATLPPPQQLKQQKNPVDKLNSTSRSEKQKMSQLEKKRPNH